MIPAPVEAGRNSRNVVAPPDHHMSGPLNESNVPADPLVLFHEWFSRVQEGRLPMRDAATLATVSESGRPSTRIVLLKEYNAEGFVFFTNYRSRKGRELATNPWAALLFYWPEWSWQIRVEGTVGKTAREESIAYFATRSRGSQIGAWASEQSEVISSCEELEDNVRRVEQKFDDNDVTCPPQWGGYRLIPESLEFWQGGEDRLHDRLVYFREGAGWNLVRLSP